MLGWLGWLLRPVIAASRRLRGSATDVQANPIPGAVRLLLIAVGIRWILSIIELPLRERVFWSGTAVGLITAAGVWGLLLLNGAAERYLYARVRSSGHAEVAAMLRLGRRIADAVAMGAGVLVILHYVGLDPTAALAGLGIGGIAVALAAQKTLENVIGGLSIIFDKAVRVGDFVKLGDISGAVDDIGLRSTRIRTLNRTILSVPNSQIANANIETLSARDKFWLHHFVGLRYETTAGQMRAVLDRPSHLSRRPSDDRSHRADPGSSDSLRPLLARHRGGRVPPRARLGGLSRNAAGSAARGHGDHRTIRDEHRISVTDPVRRRRSRPFLR